MPQIANMKHCKRAPQNGNARGRAESSESQKDPKSSQVAAKQECNNQHKLGNRLLNKTIVLPVGLTLICPPD